MEKFGVIARGLQGSNLKKLEAANWDPGVLRPFRDRKGREFVSLFNAETGKMETHQIRSHNATLPHEVWIEIDEMVTRSAQARLRMVADLRNAGLTKNITNGFSVPLLMTQRATRQGEAIVAMDPAMKGGNDRPTFDETFLPLPCIFADVWHGARDLAISKRGGLPLDMAQFEDAGRAVAEAAERLVLGNHPTYSQFSYGGGTIWGYLDYTGRTTATITAPNASGWTPETTFLEILAMRQAAYNNRKYGPFVLYLSPAWAQYLDRYYNTAVAGQTISKTLRSCLLEIDQISEIRQADFMTGWDVLMVQMESSTVRLVIGMEVTTVQWEEDGGLSQHYKVMCIMVPQLREDIEGNCGIVHGS
jgi:hypothetical protein